MPGEANIGDTQARSHIAPRCQRDEAAPSLRSQLYLQRPLPAIEAVERAATMLRSEVCEPASMLAGIHFMAKD